MGSFVFKLPDMGEGAVEAEITAWHVAVGDAVEEDQPLVDVMTDKATVEIPSPVAGTIVALHGAPGDKRPVGSELVVFEVGGAEESGAAPETTPARPEPAPPTPEPTPTEPPAPAAAAEPAQERPLASPAVRRRARDLGIDLRSVRGSGPDGRIGHRDLDRHLTAGGRPAEAAPTAVARGDGIEEVKVVGLRRIIAERVQEAKRRIPHFSYVEEIDVTALEELRRQLNATHAGQKPRLTVLPFLMRALVKALPDHPEINARYDDETGIVHRYRAVHVGIATQTPQGLVVPVVRHAEALDLWEAAAELARLAERAREGKAGREELSGSTITITSLGPLGGLASTPVINHPEVAIVGVNRIAERPVVRARQVVIRSVMNLSSSFDHRVVDGWPAAAFVQRVKALLEQPAALFMP